MNNPFEGPNYLQELLSNEERRKRKEWDELPEVKEGKELYELLPLKMRFGGYVLPKASTKFYSTESDARFFCKEGEEPSTSVLVTFKDGKRLELSLNHGIPRGKTAEEHYEEQIKRIKAGAEGASNLASVEEAWIPSGFPEESYY